MFMRVGQQDNKDRNWSLGVAGYGAAENARFRHFFFFTPQPHFRSRDLPWPSWSKIGPTSSSAVAAEIATRGYCSLRKVYDVSANTQGYCSLRIMYDVSANTCSLRMLCNVSANICSSKMIYDVSANKPIVLEKMARRCLLHCVTFPSICSEQWIFFSDVF